MKMKISGKKTGQKISIKTIYKLKTLQGAIFIKIKPYFEFIQQNSWNTTELYQRWLKQPPIDTVCKSRMKMRSNIFPPKNIKQ